MLSLDLQRDKAVLPYTYGRNDAYHLEVRSLDIYGGYSLGLLSHLDDCGSLVMGPVVVSELLLLFSFYSINLK